MSIVKTPSPQPRTDLSGIQPGEIFQMEGKVYRAFADGRSGKVRAWLIADHVLTYMTTDAASFPKTTRERYAAGPMVECPRCGRTRPASVMVRVLGEPAHCDRDPNCIRLIEGDVLH